MKSLNNVQLIGHLGNDPELVTHEGKAITKFSLATGEAWVDKITCEKKTSTEWHRIICFNKLADIVKNHLRKGAKVYLSGKLKTSKWQDKHNEHRYTTEIVAEELIMLDAKNNQKMDGKSEDQI